MRSHDARGVLAVMGSLSWMSSTTAIPIYIILYIYILSITAWLVGWLVYVGEPILGITYGSYYFLSSRLKAQEPIAIHRWVATKVNTTDHPTK